MDCAWHEDKRLIKEIETRTKVQSATELRDQVDFYCQGQSYPHFLSKTVPVLLKLLDGQPVFISTSPEQVRDIQYLGSSH